MSNNHCTTSLHLLRKKRTNIRQLFGNNQWSKLSLKEWLHADKKIWEKIWSNRQSKTKQKETRPIEATLSANSGNNIAHLVQKALAEIYLRRFLSKKNQTKEKETIPGTKHSSSAILVYFNSSSLPTGEQKEEAGKIHAGPRHCKIPNHLCCCWNATIQSVGMSLLRIKEKRILERKKSYSSCPHSHKFLLFWVDHSDIEAIAEMGRLSRILWVWEKDTEGLKCKNISLVFLLINKT